MAPRWLPEAVRRLFGGAEADSGRIRLSPVDIAGARWAGEMWDDQPVYAPRTVDVAAFLEQRPMPYIWPDDPTYVRHVRDTDDPTGWLQTSWLYTFLHHPDRSVVLDALRHPRAGCDVLSAMTVVDLLMLHSDRQVREAAVHAVWHGPDPMVLRVLRAIDEELDSGGGAPHGRDARDRVLAARPADRPVPDPDA